MKTHLSLSQRIHNAVGSQQAENIHARHSYLHGKSFAKEEWVTSGPAETNALGPMLLVDGEALKMSGMALLPAMTQLVFSVLRKFMKFIRKWAVWIPVLSAKYLVTRWSPILLKSQMTDKLHEPTF